MVVNRDSAITEVESACELFILDGPAGKPGAVV